MEPEKVVAPPFKTDMHAIWLMEREAIMRASCPLAYLPNWAGILFAISLAIGMAACAGVFGLLIGTALKAMAR